MKISVYDTYVQRPDGQRMHFDILVPEVIDDQAVVLQYGQRYLRAKGINPDALRAEKCNYCHMESASSAVEEEIATRGFAIIEMENCS